MRTTDPLPLAANMAFSRTAGCRKAPRDDPTEVRHATFGLSEGAKSTSGVGVADLLEDPPSHDGIQDGIDEHPAIALQASTAASRRTVLPGNILVMTPLPAAAHRASAG
jgi:hypothetical protein